MRTASLGKVADGLVELIDIYPTLAELTGTRPPSDVLDGVSLAPFFDHPTRLSFPTAAAQGTRNKTLAFSQYLHTAANSAAASCPFYNVGSSSTTSSESCKADPATTDVPAARSAAGISSRISAVMPVTADHSSSAPNALPTWMGFSVRELGWRYTAWMPFNGTHANWTTRERSHGVFEELYAESGDGTDFDAMDVANLAYADAHAATARRLYEEARTFFDVIVPPVPVLPTLPLPTAGGGNTATPTPASTCASVRRQGAETHARAQLYPDGFNAPPARCQS